MKSEVSRKDIFALVVLEVIILIFLWRGVSMQGVFFGADEAGTDLIHHAYSYREFFATDYLKKGKFPLWNPYIGSGTPIFGEAQTGVYYPIAIPLYLFLPPVVAFNWLIISTFMLIAIGTYVYSRSLGLSRTSAFFSAVVFTLSGSMIAHLRHVPLITAVAFMPFTFFTVDKIIHSTNSRWMILLSVLLFLSFSTGQLATTYIFMFMLICYFLVRIAVSQRTEYENLKSIVYFFFGVILGVLLSAAILTPALELFGYSTRASISLFDSLNPAYKLKHLLLFLFPYMFGDPSLGTWDLVMESFWENIGYIGILPFFLAIFALIIGVRRKQTIIISMSILGIFALFLTLGGNTFVYGLVRQWVPGFALTRVTGRFLLFVDFYLAILAGFGVSYLGKILKEKATAAQRLIVIIAIIDLFYFGYNFNNIISLSYFSPPNSVQFLQKDKDIFRVRPLSYGTEWFNAWKNSNGWRGDLIRYMVQRELLPPDFNLTYRIASPLFIYGLAGHFGVKRPSELDDVVIHSFDQNDSTHSASLLGMENVKYLLSLSEQSLGPEFNLVASLPTARDDTLTYVYLNKKWLPRAFLVGEAVYADKDVDKNILDFMISNLFDPKRQVILESNAHKSRTSGEGTVIIDLYQDDRVQLTVEAYDGGFLVLSDTYYPGWNAYIDGKEIEIYKANYAYRAIWVPKGRHAVIFSYDPLSVKLGIYVSLGTAFGIVIATLIYLKRNTLLFFGKNPDISKRQSKRKRREA